MQRERQAADLGALVPRRVAPGADRELAKAVLVALLAQRRPKVKAVLRRAQATCLTATALIAAMNWMDKEVKDPKSRFYQKVDTAHVAAMGMSCGGLMSYGASADPRIATVGIWNSGMFDPKDQKIIDGIHSSVIIITGGDSDIAHDNGKKDFEVMPARVPIFYGVYPSVGHGGTYNQDNGGPFGQVAVAWLKWQLQGDTSAKGKGYFVGDKCGLCTDSNWQVQSRSLK